MELPVLGLLFLHCKLSSRQPHPYTNDPRLGAGERTQPFPPQSASASPIRRPHSHHDDLSRLAGAPMTCDQPLCGAEANARFMAALEEAPASYMGALVWLERCI